MSNSSYDVALDDEPANNLTATDNDVLYAREGLSSDTHYISLTAYPELGSGQEIIFDGAVVCIPITDGTGPPEQLVYSNTNTSIFRYSGKWSTNEADGVPSPNSTAPYHQTSSYGASVSLNFTGEAVADYGLRDWGNWVYNVIRVQSQL